jgi:hypothetical protein
MGIQFILIGLISVFECKYIHVNDLHHELRTNDTITMLCNIKDVSYLTSVLDLDTTILPPKMYLVAGSFLIPSNADKQLQKLQKLGFNKSYIFNFRDSEFYSVIVDTIKVPADTLALKQQLSEFKVEHFIKYE